VTKLPQSHVKIAPSVGAVQALAVQVGSSPATNVPAGQVVAVPPSSVCPALQVAVQVSPVFRVEQAFQWPLVKAEGAVPVQALVVQVGFVDDISADLLRQKVIAPVKAELWVPQVVYGPDPSQQAP
jgi:hypothetical protein